LINQSELLLSVCSGACHGVSCCKLALFRSTEEDIGLLRLGIFFAA